MHPEEKQTSVTKETGTLDARIVRPVFATTWTQVLHKMWENGVEATDTQSES